MLMSGQDYRDSLRRYRPTVYVNGSAVPSVVDEPRLAPGVNAIALTYDYAFARTGAADAERETSTGCSPSRGRAQDLLEQARSRAAGLPGDRLRTALPRRRRLRGASCRLRTVIDADLGTDYAGALRRVPGEGMGRRSGDRHRHDRRQGRSHPRPHAAAEPGRLRPHRRRDERTASCSAAPRRSSPVRRTCTSCWSCRAAT